jgi:hypothetical protein
MLRVLILAILLLLVSASGANAQSASDPHDTVQLRIGARVGGALAFVQSAVRATPPTMAMHQSINGGPRPDREARGPQGVLALFDLGGEKRGLAVPVTESVSLGVRYRYLRPEDLRLEAAETGSLDEEYSSHKVVLRARWQF